MGQGSCGDSIHSYPYTVNVMSAVDFVAAALCAYRSRMGPACARLGAACTIQKLLWRMNGARRCRDSLRSHPPTVKSSRTLIALLRRCSCLACEQVARLSSAACKSLEVVIEDEWGRERGGQHLTSQQDTVTVGLTAEF